MLRGSGVRLQENTGAILEVESGLNDPMAVLLTVLTTDIVLGTRGVGVEMLGFLATQFALGTLGGLLVGWAGAATPATGAPVGCRSLSCAHRRRRALPRSGCRRWSTAAASSPCTSPPWCSRQGSIPYRAGVRRVHDALAWLAQILMFLMLGLLVYPSRLVPMLPRRAAAGAGARAALRDRPRCCLTLLPFQLPPGASDSSSPGSALRGAVPIILAMYPVLRGVPDGEGIFHLVFFVVRVEQPCQARRCAWLARRIGVAQPLVSTPPASVELISLRDYPSDFVWYSVHRASAVNGALVRDLAARLRATLLLRAATRR